MMKLSRLALLLSFVPACSSDGSPAASTEASSTGDELGSTSAADTTDGDPASTGTDPGSSTGADTTAATDEDDSGTDDGGDRPALGATPHPDCDAALAQYAVIVAENAAADPDPTVVELAYFGEDGSGTALQAFVQRAGAEHGRVDEAVLVDDAFITAALLEGPTAERLVDIETRVDLVMSLVVRDRITRVADSTPDANVSPALHYAAWDEAYCYYRGALLAHAEQADLAVTELDSIAAEIQEGFEWGHGGVEDDELAFGTDPFVVKPAAQLIAKGMFRGYDRLIETYAAAAAADDDPRAAHRAWGYFQLVEDRLAGRNTPGIAIIEEALLGAPGDIEVAEISRQLDIAWIKRTRTYTDQAIVDGLFASADGIKGAYEGRTYAKVVGPAMVEALEGFDLAAYLATFDAYIEAVAADDPVAATPLSEELTARNCEMQTALGLAECTSNTDEPA
jgi:hypothetical protein